MVESEGCSSCRAETSVVASLAAEQALGCSGFGGCSSQALEHRLSSCGAQA